MMRDKEAQPVVPTEHRLLEAAGEVFADKGFRAATIRDIIQRAGANIAAVNYHFGDKESLYAATFRYARAVCVEQYPIGANVPPHGTAREKLYAFVHGLMLRILDTGRPAWVWRLMMREMIEPTAVLDEMVEETIKPEFAVIAGIVREVTGLSPVDPRLHRYVASVLGQILFYRHAQPIVQRLNPGQQFGRAEIAELAEHVTEFSMGAMSHLARLACKARLTD